jgi:hypothetical protein
MIMIRFPLIVRAGFRGILACHDVLLRLLQDNIFAGAKFLAIGFRAKAGSRTGQVELRRVSVKKRRENRTSNPVLIESELGLRPARAILKPRGTALI